MPRQSGTAFASGWTKPAALSLDVHILGAGEGECIVVRLPNNKWGVVDCYQARIRKTATNLALRLLEDFRVRELEFVCLTHPHEDHYRGMFELLRRYPPRQFWRFPGLSMLNLKDFGDFLAALEDPSVQSATGQSMAGELHQIHVETKRRQKIDPAFITEVHAKQTLYEKPLFASSGSLAERTQLHIVGLAPGGEPSKTFAAAISAFLKSYRAAKLDGRPIAIRFPANAVSLALAIEFGSTRVILGGDVEHDGWRIALRQFDLNKLNAHAVKVSHHGSENGYCDGLWADAFAGNRGVKPVAVVAPSVKHELPTASAVCHIKQHASQLFATCNPKGDLLGESLKERPLDILGPNFGGVSLRFSAGEGLILHQLFGAAREL